MSLKTSIKHLIYNTTEDLLIGRARRFEIAKFRDPRRIAILEQGKLTKTQKRAIDDFYLESYGRRIPYTWHRHNLAITGKFDVKFFPELLFIPELERYMNQPAEYRKVFEDKNLLFLFAERGGVRTPRPILTSTAGVYRNSELEELSKYEAIDFVRNAGLCFAKPTVGTSSGQGCGSFDFRSGLDLVTGISVESLFDKLGRDFSVQEIIKCHPTITNLHPESVNTLRVMTYRWREEIRTLPIAMRIGCGGSVVDNAHAGGMFIGVTDDGTLASSALTEFNVRFERHPDSGILFDGYHIAGIPKVIEAAKRMHSMMTQMGMISWDFTVDEDGEPLVIEANINGGGIWCPQLANARPVFGDATSDILKWLRFMNSKKPHERLNYNFGYFD